MLTKNNTSSLSLIGNNPKDHENNNDKHDENDFMITNKCNNCRYCLTYQWRMGLSVDPVFLNSYPCTMIIIVKHSIGVDINVFHKFTG